MEPQPKKVVKVKVTDKRGGQQAPSVADDVALRSDSPRPADAGLRNSPGDASATAVAGQIPAQGEVLPESASAEDAPAPGGSSRTAAEEGASTGAGHDYLDDLKRLQAEFDNFRKRTRADQASAGDRGVGRVIEELLPVLDNFERAIAHGEGGEGVQLVFKDFTAALERLGLEEVPAEGAPFDPNIHEAVESRETEGLEEATIIEVYRRGYLHKERLLRPAMVVVGRPSEKESE